MGCNVCVCGLCLRFCRLVSATYLLFALFVHRVDVQLLLWTLLLPLPPLQYYHCRCYGLWPRVPTLALTTCCRACLAAFLVPDAKLHPHLATNPKLPLRVPQPSFTEFTREKPHESAHWNSVWSPAFPDAHPLASLFACLAWLSQYAHRKGPPTFSSRYRSPSHQVICPSTTSGAVPLS